MYAFLLVPSETYPVGTLNRDGYETYGMISGVILVAILVSALGTHPRIGSLTFTAKSELGIEGGVQRSDRDAGRQELLRALYPSIASAVAMASPRRWRSSCSPTSGPSPR